ncbi:ribonuclease Z [Geoglobus acetivorans]|uniref:Ribonuclease Z n=1 Tax=Geoglobus acetivorans TaxID=565033 RepID=A0ABZ3H4I6_GEOAI|nr:ribonuclease Z [Geoglobus acetivorans]
MDFKITFLGTSGTVPTPERNTSSIFVQFGGEKLLFDCGEGTQRQMMIAKTGFSISSVFITHMHTDHFIGLFGLIESMSLNGREKPLHIYCPEPDFLRKLFREFGYDNLDFRIVVTGLKDSDVVRFGNFSVVAFKTDHIVSSVGYAVIEDSFLRFSPEKAKELGIPPGPLYKKLANGETVFFRGKMVSPEMVTDGMVRGRKIVYTGDTKPTEKLVEISKDADLLIHDSSFTSELSEWAEYTKHSTALKAAEVAKEAGVRRLILTHISARYSKNTEPLLLEARRVFPNVEIARDFMEVELKRNQS